MCTIQKGTLYISHVHHTHNGYAKRYIAYLEGLLRTKSTSDELHHMSCLYKFPT